MTPERGAGTGPTAFTFSFSDIKGTQDLGIQNILVNDALDGHRACYLAYARDINVLYLVNDVGDGLLPGRSLAASGALGNSQCTVSWAAAAVSTSGNTVSLSLSLAFTAAFRGNRIFYLASRDLNDSNNSGWQVSGTWMVQ